MTQKRLLMVGRRGFTLIELLVVITIIALLATAGLIGLRGAQRAGRDAKRLSDVRSLQGPLEVYYQQTAGYPASLADLVTNNIISRVPTQPGGGAYSYGRCGGAGGNQDYGLGVALEGDNLVLDDDFDGTICGVACDDAGFRFCVRN